MFDLVNGVPVHALVVHAVVVLVPLAAVATIAIAVRPAWRARYGWLVVASAAASVALTPVAVSSGQELQKRVGDPGQHADLGGQLLWFVIPLLVTALALVLLDRRTARTQEPAVSPTAMRIVVAVAVVTALATTVQVVRIGDSGARAAWSDRIEATQP